MRQCGSAAVCCSELQCAAVCFRAGVAALASVATPGVEVREREVDEAHGVDEVAEVEQEVVPLLRREDLRPPAQQQQDRRRVPARAARGRRSNATVSAARVALVLVWAWRCCRWRWRGEGLASRGRAGGTSS